MRKFVLYHPNELGKITRWLNELSKEGLCVETWGTFWLKFKEAEEKDYQYQIDIDNSTAEPNYQRKLNLEKQGWQYVQTIGTTRHHIYRTDASDKKLVWEEEYITAYRKYLSSNIFWIAICMIAYAALCIWVLFGMRGPYALLSYMENDGFYINFQVFIQIFLIGSWIVQVVQMKRLKTLIQKAVEGSGGNYFDDHSFAKKNTIPYGMKQLFSIFLILGILIIYLQLEEKETNFDSTQKEFACVDLRNVEIEGFELKEITWKENPEVNFGNRILEGKGIFTEYYYRVNQYGIDNTGKDVQITGSYFKVRPDGLAEKVLEQLLERATTYLFEGIYRAEDKIKAEDYWSISEQKAAGFTKLIVAEPLTEPEKRPWMIFAQKEDIVIYLRYYGNLSSEVFVQELLRIYQ